MNLQPKRESITTQKEFLNTTQGLIAKVGALTLTETNFASTLDSQKFLLAGSGVVLDESGVVKPYVDDATTPGTVYITAHDVKVNGTVLVGAIESAYLKESVVTATEPGRVTVTQAFIDASNGRFHLR